MADSPAYCTLDEVRRALQERELDAPAGSSGDGPLGEDIVEDAIRAASTWFRRSARQHVYDPDADTSLTVHLPTTAATVANPIALDVPASPHRQRGQLFQGGRRTATSGRDTRYPHTRAGPYAKIRLPHGYVDALSELSVRDRGGGMTDWVADSDFDRGRGGDYYVSVDGQSAYGKSYLYLRAASIGARQDFTDLLGVTYAYGIDLSGDTIAADIRRGIACLAGATVVADDNVLTALPENATLVGADTEVQQLVNQALGERGYLSPYMGAPVQ